MWLSIYLSMHVQMARQAESENGKYFCVSLQLQDQKGHIDIDAKKSWCVSDTGCLEPAW